MAEFCSIEASQAEPTIHRYARTNILANRTGEMESPLGQDELAKQRLRVVCYIQRLRCMIGAVQSGTLGKNFTDRTGALRDQAFKVTTVAELDDILKQIFQLQKEVLKIVSSQYETDQPMLWEQQEE
uniref:Uncharacterized protein n=1 Tax=Anopheles coluzzii TaxID=1518534 RepID=A0A8W7PZY9_ANOCL